MAQSRLESRIKKVIKNAILHRAFTDEEMLKKGIEFIVFTPYFWGLIIGF